MKKLATYILAIVFLSSIIPFSSLMSIQNAIAGTPSDLVDGTQYIDGDWIVTGPESYTDEEIILSGNLTVETGGSLILNNVTLAMNCSDEAQFHIRINNGGSLVVTDGDNNPMTTDDFSNITDSPFDDDDDSGNDYEYYIEVMSGASVSFNNTIIRECGTSYQFRYGFFLYSDGASFENVIFRNNLRALIIEGNNTTIKNCTFEDKNDYGMRLYGEDTNILNCTFENNNYAVQIDSGGLNTDIQECAFENNTNAVRVRSHNAYIFDCTLINNNNGIYVGSGVRNTDIKNCTFENDEYSTNDYGIRILSVYNFTISYSDINYCKNGIYTTSSPSKGSIIHNEVHHCDYGIVLRGDNLTLNNNTIHNNTDVYDNVPGQSGMTLDNLVDSEIFNNTMENNGLDSGASDRFNLNVQNCSNLKIHNNTIQKVKLSGISVNISSSSNIDFYDNNVSNNDGTGIYIDLSSSGTNIRILNNNISKNSPSGIEVIGSASSYVEIINNEIIDNGNTVVDHVGRGIGLHYLRSYTITDNIINSSTGNPSYIGDAVLVDESYGGDFSNNTLDGNADDLYFVEIDGGSNFNFQEFHILNCTFDTSKITIEPGIFPTIYIENFLHVLCFDNNGTLPYVTVSIKNAFGSEDYNLTADENGILRFVVLKNQTINPMLGTFYYDPYNITGFYDVYVAYSSIEPIMDTSRWVSLTFPVDTLPQPPANLDAESNGTNIELTWTPSPSNDISHYLIFRNDTGPGWVEIYNSSSLPWPESLINNWTDSDAASGWATYSYRVQAVDNSSQGSEQSNIAKCGDWVVSDTQIVSNLDVQLNGSLIVLPTGNLTLGNVTIRFNNSYLLEYGIEVKAGGELNILDSDNDPQTTTDQSNISALDPTKSLYFIMNGSKFEMKNSRLSDCGSNDQLELSSWDIEDGALVMSQSPPCIRGLYITAADVTIDNNNFTGNFVSVLLDGVNNCAVSNNTFSNNTFGIYLNNTTLYILNDNEFGNNQAFPIYLLNSDNNTIDSNEITNLPQKDSGVALYGSGCAYNKVIYNNLSGALNVSGIHLHSAGGNNSIFNNNLTNISYGIRLQDSPWNTLLNNNFYNNSMFGGIIWNSDYNTIKGGTSEESYCGYSVSGSHNITISDVTFKNTSCGFSIPASSYLDITNISIDNTTTAILIAGGDSINFRNISINNCVNGIQLQSNPQNVEVHDSIINASSFTAITVFTSGDFKIYNSTFDAAVYNFDLIDSDVILFNTTYNQSRVRLDPLSTITLYWLLDVEVLDWENDPVYDANVKIRNPLGTLVFNGSTDINGFIRLIWLHERTQYQNSNETYIPYNIEATLGNHSGSRSLMVNRTMQTNVTLDNSLPSVTNVIISPLTPTTLSDLNLSYNYSDPEGDLEINTSIMWYVDLVHNSTYDNQTLIPNASTSKDQTWYCEVRPYDGSTYGPMMTSTPVTIQNTPPVFSDVKINQTNPTSSDNLNINFTFTDIDGDDNIQSQYRWYFDNGSGWTYSNVDALELPASYTKKGDKWKCNVTPNDGDNLGDTVESLFVIIGNTAPEASNVIIKPASPMSNETLTANYTYFDLDDDLESGGTIRWFKNGTLQPGLNDSKTVDSSLTLKGEVWNYTITPSDGEDNGTPVQSEPTFIENTPPTVSNIVINPSDPKTEDRLNVTYNFTDNDDDSEDRNKTVVKWLRWNGFEFFDTGYRGHNLSSEFTQKGEIWMCEVIPHDGKDVGISNQSILNVTINNSAPSVSNVRITPSNPNAETNLTANYTFSDPDEVDVDSGSIIRWYKDETLQGALNNSTKVDFSLTLKGEIWYYLITPYDGGNYGVQVKSENITIGNTPPTVSNITINPTDPTTTDRLNVNYTFNDTDDDSEDRTSTVVKWLRWNEILKEFLDTGYRGHNLSSEFTKKGEIWKCEVIPHDGKDAGISNQSIMNVTINNSAPSVSNVRITPSNPDAESNLTANYTFYDPDDDAETGSLIRWYKDEVLQGDLNDSRTLHFSNTTKGEIWYFLITPYDGEDYGIQVKSENITIGNTPPTVSDIVINPSNPTTEDRLNVTYDFDDSDDDSEDKNNTVVKWLRWNGFEFYDTGYRGHNLSSEFTLKGEIWMCEVVPHDGLDEGISTLSSMNVTIINSVPKISDAIITPVTPTADSNLTMNYTFSDPDGDSETGSIIRWFRNGTEQFGLAGSTSVHFSWTSKDDVWYYLITPYDGEDYGIQVQSESRIIGNTPPKVSNITIAPLDPVTGNDLTVDYDFYDSDGDIEGNNSIIKWLLWSGVEFYDTGYSGNTLFSAYTSRGDIWTCEVIPHDGNDYGTATASNMNVTINNSAPMILSASSIPVNPISDDDITADYLYDDPDDDMESGSTIQWFRNGMEQVDLAGSLLVDSSRTLKGDIWYYNVTPSDGEDMGATVQSEFIVIGNTPPAVSNIAVTPLMPTTEDDLVVDYDFADTDSDSESLNTIIKWLRWTGVEYADTGYRGRTLPSAYTLKEERWKCEIIPHDGADYGTSVEWGSDVMVINSKPIVTDVHITPSNPTTSSDLTANYIYSDVDNDLENGTVIIWYLNGAREPAMDNQTAVSNTLVQKGQLWYFTVEPKDGTEFGDLATSEELEIQNSPPTASALSISPDDPLGDDDLNALYTYEDEDGDVELIPEIRWYKNGVEQPAYNDNFIVNSSATKKGEYWKFILRVFDGEDYGEEVNSLSVEIENSMPVVNSLTPAPGQIVMNETESMEFFLDASDPDVEPISFKWKIGPATVGDGDYYKFETDYESVGTYTLNLSIQDYGAGFFTLYREWEIIVNNLNRLPQISSPDPIEKELKMKEDKSLEFSIVASDLDLDDTLNITWLFDDVEAQFQGSSYTYHADDAAVGDHVVTAEVDDGTDTVEYSWNLTVEAVQPEAREELFGMSYDWWGLVMAIVSAIAALIIFMFGFFIVRRKKGALRRYMMGINEISSDKDLKPGEFDEKMDDVESRLNTEFQSGKIEDLHFHMIQDTIASRRRDFRKAEVSEKFEGLPKWITQEMEGMLKDGKISRTEYEGFVSIISKTEGLTTQQKDELSEMIGEWEDEDKDSAKGDSTEDNLEGKEIDDADEDITDSEDEFVEEDLEDKGSDESDAVDEDEEQTDSEENTDDGTGEEDKSIDFEKEQEDE